MPCLTDCNHQLAIRYINITQITLGVLHQPPRMQEKAKLASLTEGRLGCDQMMSINAPLISIYVNNIQDSGLTRPI